MPDDFVFDQRPRQHFSHQNREPIASQIIQHALRDHHRRQFTDHRQVSQLKRRIAEPAKLVETAKAMILGESGTHFDPDVASAFLQTEKEFIAIRRRFADDGLMAA